MLSRNSVNYSKIPSFWRKVIALASSFTILNGAQRIFIFMMLIRWFPIKSIWKMTLISLNSVGLLLLMRAEFFVLAVAIKTTFVAIGWWNTSMQNKCWFIEALYFSEEVTLLLFIQKEALSLSLEETMPRHFILLVKSMISKTIHGVELLTLMLLETLQQVVSLIISTFTFFLVEQNSIKRKSQIQ